MQSDSNQLIAYVMTHHRQVVKSQAEAMSWLDKNVPTWRTAPVPEPISTIYYDGETEHL